MKLTKKSVGGILGVVAFLVFMFIIPDSELLPRNGLIAIGSLIAAVIWMIFGSVAEYLGMFLMCMLFVIFGKVPIGTVFGAFAGTSYWLLFGALVIGVAAQETQLLKRLALLMMKAFPATFKGQALSLVISGVVISPLIASQTAKSAIVAPIARNLSESMGYEKSSNGAKGIFMAFYTGYTSAGMAFLSASFVSYSVVGLLEGTEFATSWTQYFLIALPWLIVCTALMTIFTLRSYAPKEKATFTKDYVKGELERMGPWTWQQKTVLILMCSCLLFWILERTLGIGAWITACVAAAVIMVINIVDRNTLKSKMAWDMMLFLGCFLGIPNVLTSTGVNDWLTAVLSGPLSSLTSNIWVFIIAICIITYIARFVLVSWTSAVVIIGTILIPVCQAAGIHPFLALITVYLSTNTWNVIYQSTPVVTSMVATENKMVTHTDILPASVAYMVCNIIGCLACIPFWMLAGLC